MDVETGEICAITRGTIRKDDYLKKNVASSRTTTKSSTKQSATQASKKTINNLWTVRKSRKEFDGYTTWSYDTG